MSSQIGGTILLWYLVNRILCDHMKTMDAYVPQLPCSQWPAMYRDSAVGLCRYLSFCQIAGVLAGFSLNWPDIVQLPLSALGILVRDFMPDAYVGRRRRSRRFSIRPFFSNAKKLQRV